MVALEKRIIVALLMVGLGVLVPRTAFAGWPYTSCSRSGVSGGWTYYTGQSYCGNFHLGWGSSGTDRMRWYTNGCIAGRDMYMTYRHCFTRRSNGDTAAEHWAVVQGGWNGNTANQSGSGDAEHTIGAYCSYDWDDWLEIGSDGGGSMDTIANQGRFYPELDAIYAGKSTESYMYAGNVYQWRYLMSNPSQAYWTWNGNDRFGHTGGTTTGPGWYSSNRVNNAPGTAPGGTMDLYFNMRPTTTGDYNEDFEMVRENVSWFGDKVASNGNMRTWTRLSRKVPGAGDGWDDGAKNPGETVRFAVRGSDSYANGYAYSWDFDRGTTQGWYNGNACTLTAQNGSGSNSSMKVTWSGSTDAIIYSSGGLALNASVNTCFMARMWHSAGSTAKLYWNNGNGITESYQYEFPITADSQWHTYYLYMPNGVNWSGTINQVRLNVVRSGATSGTAYIDYMRFYNPTGVGSAKIYLGTSNGNWDILNGVAMSYEGGNDGYFYYDYTLPSSNCPQAMYCKLAPVNTASQECETDTVRKYGDEELQRLYLINGATQAAPVVESVQVAPLPVTTCSGASPNWYEATVYFSDADGSIDANNWERDAWPGINLELVGPGGTLDTSIDNSYATTASAANKYVFHHNEDSAISASCYERIGTSWTSISSGSDGTYLRGYGSGYGYTSGAQGDQANSGWIKFAFRLDAGATLGTWTARAFVRDAAGSEGYGDATFNVVANSDPSNGTIVSAPTSCNAENIYTFTCTHSDPNGWTNLCMTELLINSSVSSAGAVQMRYDPPSNLMYIHDNDATASFGSGGTPGSDTVLDSPYGKLFLKYCSVSGDGNTLTVTYAVRFNPGINGTKNLYLYTRDMCSINDSWTSKGMVTIDTMTPPMVLLDPQGTYAGGVTHSVTGALAGDSNTAVTFNGSSGAVFMPMDFPESAITTEFWIKTTETRATSLLSYASGASDNEFLIYNPANLLIHRAASTFSSGVAVNDGQWHHIVVTWQVSDGESKVYKDGVLNATGTIAAGTNISSGGVLYLAQEQDSVGGGLNDAQATAGTFDEAAVYNTVLSLERIQAHYNAGITSGGDYPAAVAADAPIGYWRLGERHGSIAFNYPSDLATGSLAQYLGDITLGQSGALTSDYNTCVSFDGSDDYLDATDGFANFTGGMTVEVWAYPTAVNNWARFIDFGNGTGTSGNNNFLLARPGTTNNLQFEVYNGTATGGTVVANNALTLNTWQHLVATLNSSGAVVLYKDGSPVATGTTAVPQNVVRTLCYIGRSNWTADAYYAGKMDELAIYNAPLSAARVLAHYNAGITSGSNYARVVMGDKPVAYWRLGEAYGNMAYSYPGPAANLARPTLSWSALSGAAGYFVGFDVGYDVDDFETTADNWAARDGTTPTNSVGMSFLSNVTLTTTTGANGACFDGKYFYRSHDQLVNKYDLNFNLVKTYTPANIFTGICWDAVNNCFWGVKWSDKAIYKFDREFNNTGGPWVIDNEPIDMATDGEFIYTNDRTGYIYRHCISSGSVSRVNDAFINMDVLTGLDWGGQGLTYLDGYLFAGHSPSYGTSTIAGRVYKIDIRNFKNPVIVGYLDTGLTEIGALATDGKRLVAMTRTGTDAMKVFSLNSDSGWKSTYINWLSTNAGGGRIFEGGLPASSANFETDQATSFDTKDYPYLSMSYRLALTDRVNLLVNIDGVGWQAITMTQSDAEDLYPIAASFNDNGTRLVQDGQWHHKIIDLDAQLDASLGVSSHVVTGLIWYKMTDTLAPYGQFWIDDFMIGDYVVGTSYTPPADLPLGKRTFYIRAADAVGNLGAIASRQFYLSSIPTCTINRTGSTPTNSTTVGYSITFSRPVSNFDVSDINLTMTGNFTAGSLSNFSGSGGSYTVQVAGISGNGQVSISVDANVANDDIGNANTAADPVIYDIDQGDFTCVISGPTSPPQALNTTSVEYTFTFNKSTYGFDMSDLSFTTDPGISSATLQEPVGVGSGAPYSTYTVAVTGIVGTGNITLNLLAGKLQDIYGNNNAAATGNKVYRINQGYPTCTITRNPTNTPATTNSSTVAYTMTFSEAVTGFTIEDITLTGSASGKTLANFVDTGDHIIYTVEVTGITSSGTVTIAVPAGVAFNEANNPNVAGQSLSYTIDKQPPMVTSIDRVGTRYTNESTAAYRVVFSEVVENVDAADFTLVDVSDAITGESINSVVVVEEQPLGKTYEVTIDTGTDGNGDLYLMVRPDIVPPGVTIEDAVGNALVDLYDAPYDEDGIVTVDRSNPTVSAITRQSPSSQYTNADTVTYRVQFGKTVINVDATDFQPVLVGTGTLAGMAVTTVTPIESLEPLGAWYDVEVNTGTGDGDLRLDVISGSDIQDNASNLMTAGYTSGELYSINRSELTCTITATQPLINNATSVGFHIQFSNSVSDFTMDDIVLGGTITGTSLGVLNGSGASYSINAINISGEGTVSIMVPAAAAHDVYGNVSTEGAPVVYTINTNTLSCTINKVQLDPSKPLDPTCATGVRFVVSFSRPVTDFTVDKIGPTDLAIASTITGASLSNFADTGTQTSYYVDVTGISGNGQVSLTIQADVAHDEYGNPNMAPSSAASYTIDQVRPTCTITGGSGATHLSAVQFPIHFSKSVTGFVAGDLSLSAPGFSPQPTLGLSGSGSNYTATISNISGSGTISLSVAAGMATDSAGNTNTAGAAASYTIDQTPLTVTVEQATGQDDPTPVVPIYFNVTFNKTVTDFGYGDVTFVGTATDITYDITGSGTNYQIEVTAALPGTVQPILAADVAEDAAGNLNEASTSVDNVVTYAPGGEPAVSSWYSSRDHGDSSSESIRLLMNSMGAPKVESRDGGIQKIEIAFTHAVEPTEVH